MSKKLYLCYHLQRIQTDFSERPGGFNFPGLITGDDSELLPISYSHSTDAKAVIEAQARLLPGWEN